MQNYLYGVDLGGTTIKFGLFTYEGENLDKFEIPTNKENEGSNILKDIATAIENNLNHHGIVKEAVRGIGIGVPGPVTNGIVNRCINLGWGVVNVKAELEALIGLPVYVSNDANIAGLGELWRGGGEGYKNLVFITLGTGVGGAVVVDGKVIDGFVGAGGEIGHASIPNLEEGFPCNCGKKGCLETVASATGVVRVAKQLLEHSDETSSLREVNDLQAKDVFDAAKLNDRVATQALEVFGKNLGYICSIIAITNNPEVFVFGGGVSKAGNIITETVQKHFKNYAFYALKEETQFKLATLGNDAGIYGAAYLARIE
jgi:glucokinase